MSGVKRSIRTRKFGSRNQHIRIEEDNTYNLLDILRGDCDLEKKELEEEFRKSTPEGMIEKIIFELQAILKANDLPSDPDENYCSEEYAKDPEAYKAKHIKSRFGLFGHTWNLHTQVEKMTESTLCRESAAALLVAARLQHRINHREFDEVSTISALHLAVTMSRLKMLDMEHEAAAGKARMDGVKHAIAENIKQKEAWNALAVEEFEALSKNTKLAKEEIYRKICRKLRLLGIHKEPDTIKKAIIRNQKIGK